VARRSRDYARELARPSAWRPTLKRGAAAAGDVRRMRLSPRLWIGGGLALLLVLVAILAPVLAPFDPIEVDTSRLLRGPNPVNWFGTDDLGRDIFSRVIWGSRISLTVGLISVTIGLVFGTALGLITGFRGGWVDLLLMRFVDALLAFPGLVLALAITAALGPQIQNVMIAIGILAVPNYARLTRGQVIAIRHRDFILAARAVGVPSARLVLRHIFPNIVNPLIVAASLAIGFAILAEAGLSFLGLGSQPPSPSWGQDIAYSQRQVVHGRWWTIAAPGTAIFLAIFAFNMLGDGLRDALDPRLRRRG
jgi:peptide/nickel transport system permease protein